MNQPYSKQIPQRKDRPKQSPPTQSRVVPSRAAENVVESKGKRFNTAKVIQKTPKRSDGVAHFSNNQDKLNPKKKNLKQNQTKFSKSKKTKNVKETPWEKERLKGAKVYRLTAFTTTDNIDKRFASYRRQAAIRKILVTLIIILVILTVIGRYFDFSKTGEFDLITGVEQKND